MLAKRDFAMAMSMGSAPGGPAADMNVTPLIDVLLTLLVIFMVITPLTPKGEAALVPQPPPPNSKPLANNNRTVVVPVLKSNTSQPQFKINEDTVRLQDLQPRLETIYKTRAEKVLFVKADSDLSWSNVAQVIDIAHSAGVDKVGLITAKIEGGS